MHSAEPKCFFLSNSPRGRCRVERDDSRVVSRYVPRLRNWNRHCRRRTTAVDASIAPGSSFHWKPPTAAATPDTRPFTVARIHSREPGNSCPDLFRFTFNVGGRTSVRGSDNCGRVLEVSNECRTVDRSRGRFLKREPTSGIDFPRSRWALFRASDA